MRVEMDCTVGELDVSPPFMRGGGFPAGGRMPMKAVEDVTPTSTSVPDVSQAAMIGMKPFGARRSN